MSDRISAVITPPRTPPISISNTTTEANRTGSWKYIRPAYHDRVAPCIVGCPTAVDIQGYMAMLRQGRVAEACELILLENPMPAVTGRVCNHPCEGECNRASFDEAVAIHAVERMLGDRILQSPLPPPVPRQHEEAVGVVGSGPAGLACAYHLARLGYRVEIFEQNERPGGMLRVGIPEYRLPRAILHAQIERIEALGVRINCGFRAGEDIEWSALTAEFAAIFIASGAHVSRPAGFEAPQVRALWSGLDFLNAVNRGERPHIGKQVVVIGGGNTAMDCARTAVRLGAEVRVVYRRTRAEMPAIAEEIADAEREGVQFIFLAAPIKLDASVKPAQLVCQPMMLGAADASGRRRPVPAAEPPTVMAADTILTAIGEDPELDLLPEGVDAQPDEWGSSPITNIFLGGDVAGDARTVASALGAGKRAAIGIDRYLRHCRGEASPGAALDDLCVGGEGALSMARWLHADPVERVDPVDDVVAFDDINTNHFAHADRNIDRRTAVAAAFAETNAGLAADAALAEAGRCFNCGVCNECELCQIYCGDAAIVRGSNGARFEIRLDYCKGCGVCAAECPRGAILMTREGL
jgi:NADPH-dependent glutamate synthase beta subunit-like oxidoreductase/ferredoxin